ncbi:Golgin subfamily A member 7/ERF4 family-domain-containing protein [Mycena maculata]|uniref:Ras modification protein ERF4 n=1 Tax=Mycena maculata TaxID=230809 RepID=A0AAD7JUA4_9AGAR|nr:Golgin subfamily A member 7/ERF4 family-domain-containing protein [Mycena maculata]
MADNGGVDNANVNAPPSYAAPSPDMEDEGGIREGVDAGVDGVEGQGQRQSAVAPKGDDERERPQRESSIWPNDMPPSPPLTRPNTAHGEDEEREKVAEVDITDLLQHGDGAGSEDSNHEFSRTVVEHGSGYGVGKELELEEGKEEEEEEEEEEEIKPRATVVRQPSRIDLDAKLEPQPWDLVEPPETNGEYYASVKQQYNTLQSSRARALIPKSSYYFGPPPSDSAYGTPPVGQIGLHHPREILRVERDYTGGELVQFAPIYPLELEGRITPTQFLETINAINELLISAHSLRHSFLDNMLSVLTLQLSRVLVTSHYEKEMHRLQQLLEQLNAEVYNPVGLNILWPRRVAFLFMEIEYY